MLVLSVLAHAAALHGVQEIAPASADAGEAALEGGGDEGAAKVATAGVIPELVEATRGAAGALADKARIDAERRELVATAREELRRGRLLLGRFLLRANRIDAEERGQAFDHAAAQGRYDARVAELREALRGARVREAVPLVFGDLRYYGQPGGFMGEALLESGGSCEQIAQLVAASVYDAGQGGAIALRYYGGVMPDGATHLTAVERTGEGEHDLLTGKPALRKGTRFSPEELVEAYARTHGLAAQPPGGVVARVAASPSALLQNAASPSASPSSTDAPAPASGARPTLTSGFPPNQDRYPGALPMFAAHAVGELAGDEEPGEGASENDARHCAYFLRMALLHPPSIDVEVPEESGLAFVRMEPRRIPRADRLEREAGLLLEAEKLAKLEGGPSEEADRLMGLACLAAVGETAVVDFMLAGQHRLAKLAAEKQSAAREEGRRRLASIAWSGEEGRRIRQALIESYAGRSWLLLALPGAEDVAVEVAGETKRDNWGKVSLLAALLVAPRTRSRALALLRGMAPPQQIEVMHEVFHAHDHMRPWASNFDLAVEEGAGSGELYRVYRVFRGLAFRLWESHRDPEEVLGALAVEADRAGISAEWRAALIDYYARNALGLYANRPGGFALVGMLKRAALESGHGSLDLLVRMLVYIEAEGRLDPRTLADAFHGAGRPLVGTAARP